MEPGTVLCRFKDPLPGAGQIAVLHGKGPAAERFTGRDGEVRGIAALGVFYEVGLVHHFYPLIVGTAETPPDDVDGCAVDDITALAASLCI